MSALLLSLLTSKVAIGIGAVFIAIVGAFMKGRLSGRELERANQRAEEALAQDVADQVQNDVGALPPDLAREELKKWGK